MSEFNEINLTAIGITLIGVLLSISITISASIRDISILERISIAILVFLVLLFAIKLLTKQGKGVLAYLAKWTIT